MKYFTLFTVTLLLIAFDLKSEVKALPSTSSTSSKLPKISAECEYLRTADSQIQKIKLSNSTTIINNATSIKDIQKRLRITIDGTRQVCNIPQLPLSQELRGILPALNTTSKMIVVTSADKRIDAINSETEKFLKDVLSGTIQPDGQVKKANGLSIAEQLRVMGVKTEIFGSTP